MLRKSIVLCLVSASILSAASRGYTQTYPFPRPGDAEEIKKNLHQIFATYIRFRDGVPGTTSAYDASVRNFRQTQDQFKNLNGVIKVQSSVNCQRFLNAYENITDQVAALQNELRAGLPPGASFHLTGANILPAARLHVLITLGSAFALQIQQNSEAGFGLLDLQTQREQCTVPNREQWKRLNFELAKSMTESSLALVGVPGLVTMRTMEDLLTDKIAAKEKSDRRLFWGSTIVGTALSILAWYLVPIFAEVMFGPAIYGGALSIFGMRTGAIVAELWAFRALDEHYLFPEDRIFLDRRAVVSWDDFMSSAESIIGSGLNSPRIYYDLLTQSFAHLATKMEAVLEPVQPVLLEAERRFGSIDRAVGGVHAP